MSKKFTSKYTIIKNGTDTTTDDTDDTNTDNDLGSDYKYKSIIKSDYVKPASGSKQDNFTRHEIRQKLKGYRALRTPEEKRYLLNLKPFKVWIRYFNTVTKEFRVGGLLKLVDPELRFIMLVNTTKNITWSVQLNDSIIFVPKEITQNKQQNKQQQQQQKIKNKEPINNQDQEQSRREEVIKAKLYALYKNGKLRKA